MDQHNKTIEDWINAAADLSQQAIDQQEGGPFGCIIVKGGVVVGQGYNCVTSTHDPTAHAEVVAIRDACRNLNTHQLEGCVIYTSCEPCPMCMGAIYWARPDKVYFANTRQDAAAIGFDDAFIYEEISRAIDQRSIPCIRVSSVKAHTVFEKWKDKKDKMLY